MQKEQTCRCYLFELVILSTETVLHVLAQSIAAIAHSPLSVQPSWSQFHRNYAHHETHLQAVGKAVVCSQKAYSSYTHHHFINNAAFHAWSHTIWSEILYKGNHSLISTFGVFKFYHDREPIWHLSQYKMLSPIKSFHIYYTEWCLSMQLLCMHVTFEY